jgi:hypothetical protein
MGKIIDFQGPGSKLRSNVQFLPNGLEFKKHLMCKDVMAKLFEIDISM